MENPQPNYRPSNAPVGQLKTNRGLLKVILLSFITFGIYGLIFWYSIGEDINVIASRYDGKKTMNFALLIFLIAPITFGIAPIVWMHRISNRIGGELSRRNVNYTFSATDFWLWGVLGGLIVVGPFIYLHKICEAMNNLAGHYNVNG